MYPKKKKYDTRNEKRLFVVSCEGTVTEVDYLKRLEKLFYSSCIIEPLHDTNKSAPNHVLDRIRNYKGAMKRGDELWCVVDKDKWADTQLDEIAMWAKDAQGEIFRGFGLSNPKIEVWLLLHFQEWHAGDALISSLCKFIPNYDKSLEGWKLTREDIDIAIGRGKCLTPDGQPPRETQGTNLWLLADHVKSSA